MVSLFFIVLCSVPGAPPQPVEGHNTSSTSIFVMWGEVPADKQHGKIHNYTVIYKMSRGDAETENRVVSLARQIELKYLTEYTEYSIQVLATNMKGDGPPSAAISVRTDQDGKYMYKEKGIKFLG